MCSLCKHTYMFALFDTPWYVDHCNQPPPQGIDLEKGHVFSNPEVSVWKNGVWSPMLQRGFAYAAMRTGKKWTKNMPPKFLVQDGDESHGTIREKSPKKTNLSPCSAHKKRDDRAMLLWSLRKQNGAHQNTWTDSVIFSHGKTREFVEIDFVFLVRSWLQNKPWKYPEVKLLSPSNRNYVLKIIGPFRDSKQTAEVIIIAPLVEI